MKKIIIAAAVVLSTGIITVATYNRDAKTTKEVQMTVVLDKNVTATAD